MQRDKADMQPKLLPAIPPKQIVVVDEHGNAVGMLIANPHQRSPRRLDLHAKYPVPCSKQANITTEWLKENFEENVLTSVPRSVMFEEFCNFCREYRIKPFNQAVFGKVVRACFPNLATRRLGVRGQSRYHYAGLSVKLTSRYAAKFHGSPDHQKILRTPTNSQRRQVAAHVTIDGREWKVPHPNQSFHPKVAVKSPLATWFAPLYPTEDEVLIPSGFDREEMTMFLNFYVGFNRTLVLHLKRLDFEAAQEHFQNFSGAVPEKCCEMVKTSSICNFIALCDDVMYQDVTIELLPNCLETLTTDFRVRIRKLAKSIPVWIEENGICDVTVSYEITKTRLEAAKKWCDYVYRVTPLCHVTGEARKHLKDPSIVSRLLYDLQHMNVCDIVDQCAFASQNTKIGRSKLLKIRDEATHHVNHFCKLLKHQSSVEAYAAHVEKIVNKHAGLRPEPRLGDDSTRTKRSGSVITEKTRRFLMIWATYSSKMLTAVTLEPSEAIGTFHLMLILFGDYVNHVVQLREERAKRVNLLNSTVAKGSSYHSRLRMYGTDDPTRQYAQQRAVRPPYPAHIKPLSYKTPHVVHNSSTYSAPAPSGGCKSEPAVVVEPAYSTSESFYLLPGNENGSDPSADVSHELSVC